MRAIMKTALEAVAGGLVLAVGVAWLSGGCGKRIDPGSDPTPAERVPDDASIVSVEQFWDLGFERFSGTIASSRHATVSSKILARIEAIRVRAGSEVREGDVLVQLDQRDLEARMRAARESVSGSRASLDLARSELERVEGLWRANVASLQQLEQVRAQFELAKSDFDRTQEQLRDAEVAVSHAVIRSPVSGRVVDRLAEPGDTAAPGAPLLRIYDPGALRLEVPVRESLAMRLTPGQQIDVRIDAIESDVAGAIDEIVPHAEPGARTFLVKIRLPSDVRLYSGMFGRAKIPFRETLRFRIPVEAVQTIGQLEFAEVARPDGSIERRWITIGPVAGSGWVEVLSGLSPGEDVVLRMSSVNSNESSSVPTGEVGAELQAEVVHRARNALAPLKLALRTTLEGALSNGGPMNAIDVCRIRAPQIALDSSSRSILVGRTSHRVRNRINAPKLWMEPSLNEFRAMPVAAGAYRVVSIDEERIGYTEPIYLEPLCIVCHGTSIDESLSLRIRNLYPFDQAVGFSPGDFRGLFWVEINRSEFADGLHLR